MTDHHHHAPGTACLAADARGVLEAGGERWTAMRAATYGALSGAARPLSAYDLADQLSESQGRRVAPNSVYRILDLFVRTNLARKLESANAYLANTHPACAHDCVWLICEGCGQVEHRDDDRAVAGVLAIAATGGFTPTRPVLEVLGRCGRCAGAGGAPRP